MLDRDEFFDSYFKDGASRLQTDLNPENEEGKPHLPSEIGWNGDDHDPNGHCFWTGKNNMDDIWELQDSNIAEQELGWTPGDMDGRSMYRIDDNNPENHNYRIATGEEGSAFPDLFTGYNDEGELDPSIYPGKTNGGQPEMVSDQIRTSELDVSDKSSQFRNPSKDNQTMLNEAEDIREMTDESSKQIALEDWNQRASELDQKLTSCQDYSDVRIQDHQNTLNSNTATEKEKEIAQNGLDFYDGENGYKNQLANSQEELRNQYASLNEGSGYDTSKPIPSNENGLEMNTDKNCLYNMQDSPAESNNVQGVDIGCLSKGMESEDSKKDLSQVNGMTM